MVLLLLAIVTAIVVLTIVTIVFIWKAGSPQVYLYEDSTALPTTVDEADNIAIKYGGTLATPTQVQDAYNAGAEWCAAGWASDGNIYFPMQSTQAACGAKGINKGKCSNFGGACGVLIYGKKPSSGTSNVRGFNVSQWSQWEWYNPLHS